MGPIGSSETPVLNHYTPHNNAEDGRSEIKDSGEDLLRFFMNLEPSVLYVMLSCGVSWKFVNACNGACLFLRVVMGH